MGRWPTSPVRPPPPVLPPPNVRAALELLPAAEPAARCAWAGIELKRTIVATPKNFFMITHLGCARSVSATEACGKSDARTHNSTTQIYKDLVLALPNIRRRRYSVAEFAPTFVKFPGDATGEE